MSLAQSFVIALKSLSGTSPRQLRTADGSPPRRHRRRRSEAAALLLTLRELFADDRIGRVLERLDAGPSAHKKGGYPDDSVYGTTEQKQNVVSLENDERSLAVRDQRALLPHSAPSCPIFESSENHRPLRSEGVRARNSHSNVIVLSIDEDEAVSLIRKVLKWPPRKRNSTNFVIPLNKEKDKTVAVIQNAVNRVKEKKRKEKVAIPGHHFLLEFVIHLMLLEAP